MANPSLASRFASVSNYSIEPCQSNQFAPRENPECVTTAPLTDGAGDGWILVDALPGDAAANPQRGKCPLEGLFAMDMD